MIFNLYKNELNKLKKETILFMALSLLLNMFFLYKSYNGWNQESVLGINVFLMGMTFVIPFMLAEAKLISQDWKDNTIYLIMSLPISGKKLFFVKYLAVITQYIVLSLSSILIFAVQSIVFLQRTNKFDFFLQQVKEILNITTFNSSIFLYILSISVLVYLTSIVLLSALVGKMFKKYSGLITFITGTVVILGSIKAIGYLIDKVFSFMNVHMKYDINFLPVDIIRDFGYGCLISSTIILIVTGLIYFITYKVYDNKIEL